jgi:hypothetical protein
MRRLVFLTAVALLAISAASYAQVLQKGSIRVKLNGGIAPAKLPRDRSAAVSVSVSTQISPTRDNEQPQLKKIQIAINRFGHLDATGLPVCEVDDIQPATTEKALAACRGSLVGEGHFAAEVALDRQGGFPSDAKMYAFNGRYQGKPAILAHVYGEDPVPTSFTLPFVISHRAGTFGTVLTGAIPGKSGNAVTSLSLRLSRSYRYRGKTHSFATASCPAPKGVNVASFSFAKVDYKFADGRKLESVLGGTCKPR